MANSVSLKGTQVNLVRIYAEWIDFNVRIISVYACLCRISLTANHVRLSKYTHYIKSAALSLTSILMQSILPRQLQ